MASSRILMRTTNTGRLALSTARPASVYPLVQLRFSSSAPASILDANLWRSLIPKPLRRENRQARKSLKSKEWNPATYFIVMFLFIGSMSIQMIALRNSFDRYVRQSEVRIGLLKEVVEKIQAGEKVDVEKVLGTGDPQKEADWEEVLKQIERDEAALARKGQKQDKSKPAESQSTTASAIQDSSKQSGSNAAPEKSKQGGYANFF